VRPTLSTGSEGREATDTVLVDPGGMSIHLSTPCRELLAIQAGVISRAQALEQGIPAQSIHWLISTGRWQVLRRGVYATFTGEPSRQAALWAVILRAGAGAALSHQTAAELFNVTDRMSSLIHVSVPVGRHVTVIPGVVIHRSTRLADAIHPSLLPPRTRIEETLLDLAQQATTFDAAFSAYCAGCQRRLTTPSKLLHAMDGRKKMRWRTELAHALADIQAGVHSLLEYRYVRHVERPHGLPRARRQAGVPADGRSRYLDNLYDGYGLCVELDGREAHPDDRRWQDVRRTNAVTVRGITTLRYTWTDVNYRPCSTATQIGAALANLGWPGRLRPCGPTCPIALARVS
jgi:very-short-patch-repair endonuclease